MAVICWAVPSGMVALAADTAMEDKGAPETVRVPVPVMAPDAALTLAVPSFIPVASPAALTAITPPGELVHATELVMFWVLPSEYVPVAVNCCEVPLAICAVEGETVRPVSTAGVTVTVPLDAEEPLKLQEICVEPGASLEARPELEIVATWGLLEYQTAWLVRFWVEPSEKVPVAVNCTVVPLAKVGF